MSKYLNLLTARSLGWVGGRNLAFEERSVEFNATRLRCQRHTQQHIAETLGLSPATVSRILRARGLSLLSALEPQQRLPRYGRATPGEIIHINIKKFSRFDRVGHRITGDRTGQGVGLEYVHVAIDDHSLVLAFAQNLYNFSRFRFRRL